MTTRLCSVEDVRQREGISATVDDNMIGKIIDAATTVINNKTRRVWVASSLTTRKFDAAEDVNGLELTFDMDCAGIDTITNGDGTTVTSSEYFTNPSNDTPYYSIQLKPSGSIAWEPDSNGDYRDAISISGYWGYTQNDVPNEVQEAAIQLSAFYYRIKDQNLNDVTAVDAGTFIIPAGSPATVRDILKPLQRWAT